MDKVRKENAKKALLVMSTRVDVNASKMCLDVICTVNASTVTILMEKNVLGSEQLPCSSGKHRHHENSTAGLKWKSFTEIKASGTVAVQWTMFEELVLVELILGLLARNKLEPRGLCREYNYIVDTVRPTSMGQYLGKKTEKQVTKKLSTFLNSQKVFGTLMKEQIRMNFGDS